MIEADKVKPNRLKIFYLLAQEKKGDNYKFGPVVATLSKSGKTVERRIGGPFNSVTVHLYGTILTLYVEIVHLSNLLVLFRCEHVRWYIW